MLRLKSLFCLDDLFTSEWVISLSCPVHCCFVALHDYDRYALWLVASPSFASLPPAPSEILLVLPNSFLNPVVPFESTIPTYMWYLPATPNLYFHVPSRNLFKSFAFVTVQAHGAVRGNQYLSCQKYFDGSFN